MTGRVIKIYNHGHFAAAVENGAVVGTVEINATAGGWRVKCREGDWLELSWDVALETLQSGKDSISRLADAISAK